MEQLSEALGILCDVDYQDKCKQVASMEKQIEALERKLYHTEISFLWMKERNAWFTFMRCFGASHDDEFQYFLDNLNRTVMCTCPHCLEPDHHNYTDEDFVNIDALLNAGELKEIKEAKDCALFARFQEICAEYKVPIPGEIDRPRNDGVHQGLAVALGLWDFDRTSESWAARIFRLPYAAHVDTLYRMYYAYRPPEDKNGDDITDTSFNEWFTYEGVSLLP